MLNSETFEKIAARFPAAVQLHEQYGMLTVEIGRDSLIDLLSFLKNEEGFGFLTTLCGLHFPKNMGRELGVQYQLHSLTRNQRIRVKTFFSDGNPHVPTATTVFKSANWMERQEFDFFGIIFDGHPDLRRILNVEDMEVHPMRKEYRLEDGTRTDKDDRFFGRDQHDGRTFDRRPDRVYLQ